MEMHLGKIIGGPHYLYPHSQQGLRIESMPCYRDARLKYTICPLT